MQETVFFFLNTPPPVLTLLVHTGVRETSQPLPHSCLCVCHRHVMGGSKLCPWDSTRGSNRVESTVGISGQAGMMEPVMKGLIWGPLKPTEIMSSCFVFTRFHCNGQALLTHFRSRGRMKEF